MADAGAPVELRKVVKYYGDFCAVKGVSLSIHAGEFLTLLGPSGSGKTTTLMMVAGFEHVDDGDVLIGGQVMTDVPPYARDLGFVFQSYALFPHMTVNENLAFPLTTRGLRSREIEPRIARALERVRLAGLGDRYPSQLSGGQQQRVALARAIIFDPPVLLMDEPLGALDKKLRQQMQLEIKHLQQELNVTVIYVTHDQEEALTMSDRIAVMTEGDIAQIGTPEELYEAPRNRFVADFIGETNFIEGKVAAIGERSTEVACQSGLRLVLPPVDGLALGNRVEAAIRPERVVLRSGPAEVGDNGWCWNEAVVEEVIYIGEKRKYRLRIDDLLLIADQQVGTGVPGFAQGDRLSIGWHAGDLRVVGKS